MRIRTTIGLIGLLCASSLLSAQPMPGNTAKANKRWQFQYNGGLYLDLTGEFLFTGYKFNVYPLSYSNSTGSTMIVGYRDNYEVKRYSKNNRNALSLAFTYARWRDIYGDYYDPLEKWPGVSRPVRAYQISANYYRVNHYRRNNELHWGAGLLLHGIKNDLISYRYDRDPSMNEERFIFTKHPKTITWHPGIALTTNYMYNVNKVLQIGTALNLNIVHRQGINNGSIACCIGIKF